MQLKSINRRYHLTYERHTFSQLKFTGSRVNRIAKHSSLVMFIKTIKLFTASKRFINAHLYK